jgi:DNA-binding NarL/FixJ family response regulator
VLEQGERQVRVAVVDDHQSLRHLLLLNLEIAGGFEIVGEGGDGDDAIRLATEQAPDVLVLDIGLPGRDGFEVLSVLREAAPWTRTVVFTGWTGARDQERVLAAGASRYVQKSDLAAIVDAVREVGMLATAERADGA